MSYTTCKKAINFDLDTKALKKYYPGKNYRHAYTDIKKFMESEGFLHRQWSGYNSKEKLSMQDIQMITKKLSKTFPWLKKCVNRFDVTDIGEQHDLTHLITGKAAGKVKEVQKEAVKSEKRKAPFSVEKTNKMAAKISRQPKQQSKNKSKNMER